VARKIQTVCERTVDIGGSHLRPHASIGLAVFPDQATDAAGILAAAEADLARARCAEPAAILT
jgi:GGDEF domain-containing protein